MSLVADSGDAGGRDHGAIDDFRFARIGADGINVVIIIFFSLYEMKDIFVNIPQTVRGVSGPPLTLCQITLLRSIHPYSSVNARATRQGKPKRCLL